MISVRIADIRTLVRRGLRSETVGNTFWVAAAAGGNAALGALTSAIYARWLGVDSFGVFTLIVSLMTMMTALSDLGISGSLIRFGSQRIAEQDASGFRRVLSIAFRAKLALSALILLLAVLFLNPIVSHTFTHVTGEITSYFTLSLAAVAFSMVAGIFPPIFQAFRKFRLQALLSLFPSVVKLLLVVALLHLLSRITVTLGIWVEIVTTFLLLVFSFSLSPERRLISGDRDPALRKSMLSFNKWLALYYVVNLVGGRVDLFFVGGMASATSLGLYVAASKISAMVIVVTNSYLTVLLPDLSGALDATLLRRKQKQSIAMVALFVGGILLLGALAHLVVTVIYGDSFAGSAPLLQVMCVGLIFTVMAYPVNAMLFALNRSVVFPLSSFLGVAALTAGNAWLVPTLGAQGAAIAFSLSGVISFGASLILYLVITRKRGLEPA